MLAISGGKHKGRKLKVPKSARPTSSLVRQALFNIWQQEIDGAHFLDLCAGSGAMGMEALSRGAASACFVDKNRQAIQMIRQNLELLKEEGELLCMPALAALKKLQGAHFSHIFLDPPYDVDISSWLPSLPPGAKICIETSRKITCPEHLSIIDERTFGDTKLTFLE